MRNLTYVTGNCKGYVCKSRDAVNKHDQAKSESPKLDRMHLKLIQDNGEDNSAGEFRKKIKRTCFFGDNEGQTASSCPLKKDFIKKKRKGTAQ